MRQKIISFTAFFLAALLFTSIFTPSASAIDFESEIQLEGDAEFSLTTSQLQLFDFKNFAPGETRTGKIHVKNTTKEKMTFSILSIISYSEDNRLFDALMLRISLHGEELYSGPYGGSEERITEPVTVRPGQETVFDVEVSFPAEYGNGYQDIEMDSIWTFESQGFENNTGDENKDNENQASEPADAGDKGPGSNDASGHTGKSPDKVTPSEDIGTGPSSSVKTGMDLTLSNSDFVVGLILLGLCLLAVIITVLRICAAKKELQNRDKK